MSGTDKIIIRPENSFINSCSLKNSLDMLSISLKKTTTRLTINSVPDEKYTRKSLKVNLLFILLSLSLSCRPTSQQTMCPRQAQNKIK